MPLVPTGTLVADAAARGAAVAAFNVITLEHVEAVVAGAERAGLPVILQVSENAVRFHGGRPGPLAAAAAECARQGTAPLALHLDHVKDRALLEQAPGCGFGSVMFDAAHLPYAQNVAATRKAAAWAHAHGLWLEAELGEVGGKDGRGPLDAHAPGARTDPDEARRFTEATGVDALAVAVGSSHAMTTRDARLDHALLGALHRALDVPLVLHGSSGVPDAELARAVAGGIAKVNIGTALNIAMTGAVRAALAAEPERVDPRAYLREGREAMTDAVVRMLAAVSGEGRPH
ncbi:class II fructose-bisphosphate aldolase [Streptomyces sp. DSM 42041]|uniref:Class II fructose-bisphosphate aldolase n=1 Tax=Streptomyces hazeniae TaxID=3075538 RepID=A0ABU2NM31_9ACTN|nr:class II fructose-bisphosphate aldolase [Streptomyces sp. DSM 42041]MDT0378039.1 class II fructose-bisphosphate aldolase [Streptomyces sp. DSM 42041]